MFNKTIFAFFISLFASSSIFAQEYVVSAYAQIVESNPGVIVERRWVKYQTYEGNNAGVGTALGIVSGGVVGSTLGKGKGHIAGAIGGAVLGGLLGNSIGRSSENRQDCYMFEYTIRLNNGSLLTILQSPNVNLAQGQRVLLERSNDNRWFVIPQY